MVNFYESDDNLCDVVARFLEWGLADGDPVVVIATEPHRKGFTDRLAAKGLDISRARAEDRLVLLDAEETLSRFMVDSMPDQLRFKKTIGSVLDRLRAGRASASILAYGEMEDLLWQRENLAAAIRLEELWNNLQRERSFMLLCAHVMASETAAVPHPLGEHVRTLTVEIA